PSRLPFLGLADRLGAIYGLLDAEIARARSDATAGHERDDILALLVAARYEDREGGPGGGESGGGEPMSDEELRCHLLTLLIGGHETTATTLCWAVHCLIGAPASPGQTELHHLRDELRAAGRVDPGRVRELSYLGAAIQESMRLFPIATGVSRRLK